ncbi:MAG: bifunctional diguanylate cyclase/phosphodiesterase [Cyanobacteria bacterium J06648_16]
MNDTRLRHDMEGSLLQKILSALKILSLEKIDDERFVVIGDLPTWAEDTFECLSNTNIPFTAAAFSSFFENFLIDAELFWREKSAKFLRSGVWVETGKSDKEISLEAIALYLDQRQIVLVEASEAGKSEKFRWLQTARQEQLNIISERKIAETQLLSAKLYDALTGLPNRAFFLSQLETQFERSLWSHQSTFALALLNLDRFKALNHNLGPTDSDRVLAAVADRIRRCIRRDDVPVRFGADEFGVMLTSTASRDDVLAIVQRLQDQIAQPIKIDTQALMLTACIGIAMSDEGYHNARDLLRDASIAMHQAKALGSGRSVLFDRGMRQRALEVWSLETDLRQALAQDQLEVWYQPIVSLRSRQTVGFEALLRWQHDSHGWISPAKFIPLAEETGLVCEIDRWVLRRVCQTLKTWKQDGSTPCVNVNISALHLVNNGLIDTVRSVLKETQTAPQQIRLEITESSLLVDMNLATSVLSQLRQLGVEIAIDDFGTGYASLNYLQTLPVDKLKIDGYFTETILTRGTDVVGTIIDLAHRLELEVTAERVENIEQLQSLEQLGCDTIQGYLISRPLPAAEAQRWSHLRQSFDPAE